METFDYCLRALEATSDLEEGGGEDLLINARRNQNRRNDANDGNSGGGVVNIP